MVHHLHGSGRPHIHQDDGGLIFLKGGHRDHDTVTAHRSRIVHLDVQSGLDARPHYDGFHPGHLDHAGTHRVEDRRNHRGDDAVLHLLHRHAKQVQHILDLNSVLVGGLDPVGGDPRLEVDLLLVDPSDHNVAVPNVDGKKHPVHLKLYLSIPYLSAAGQLPRNGFTTPTHRSPRPGRAGAQFRSVGAGPFPPQ